MRSPSTQMRVRIRTALAGGVCFLAVLLPSCGSAARRNVLSNPISRAQLTDMPFGDYSFWLQPWRSSLVTRPATFLKDAIGINFNVTPRQASATAKLLHASGFRRARLEIGWGAMRYSDPSELADPSQWATYIRAMKENGIRPLILLNSNDEVPVPMKALKLTVAASAATGARRVVLTSASAAQVVPGLTGFNENSVAAQVLITSMAGNVARLSQPLPARLAAGYAAASTLRYAPFAPPTLADSSPNPRFEQTLAGWETYVRAVTQFVARVYGSDNFDVEVWNELTFGSDFLNEASYYSPVPDPGTTGSVTNALLAATVQTLRDPANRVTGVQIGDGFSNETPFVSGATVPAGVDALDKHYYPPDARISPSSLKEPARNSIDAVRAVSRRPFTPSFRAFFPEYDLTGITTETLMRDLSPFQTMIDGTPHGATTAPAGGEAPTMWMTEDGLSRSDALANGLPAADLAEFQAKAALRFYVSYASEGVSAIDLYAADGGSDWQMIPQAFFNAVDVRPSSYPARLGGLTMAAVGRMTSTLFGAQTITNPRQLKLTSIAQNGNASEFTGNRTAAFPNLYDRDRLAFFPFQVSQNKFIVAVYVMTNNLTRRYTSAPASGQTRYDLPSEKYRLTIKNVHAASATVSLYDPLRGTSQPVSIVSRSGHQIIVQLDATDSPRMLTINDRAR